MHELTIAQRHFAKKMQPLTLPARRQVESFLLAPYGLGSEQRARAALLQRRLQWMQLGIPNDDMPPTLQLDYIR